MGPRADYVQWSLASSSVGYKYTTVDVMSERERESFFLPVTLVFDANSRIILIMFMDSASPEFIMLNFKQHCWYGNEDHGMIF
jgi:hypothetical protein